MPFLKTDQDALNIAVEACNNEISFLGNDTMGFSAGFTMMYHALGMHKPWERKSLKHAWKGEPPRKVDILFWKSVSRPIKAASSGLIKWKRFTINIASFIGRFYSKA